MKISIIMATYNAEDTLRQAIQSVVKQNYQQTELIVIDGQSTDGTIDIIKEYEQYITYWTSEPDAGVYDAMNKGISKATGDVIAFLNSDDWYEDNAFEQVSAYFEQNEIDILVGNVNCILNNQSYQERTEVPNPEELRLQMIYYHQGMFVRKEVFEQVGKFNLNYKIVADYDWTLRVYLQGYSFMVVKVTFANYRCDGLSSIQRYRGMREQKEIACLYASGSEKVISQINKFYDNVEDSLELTLYNIVWKYAPSFVREICGEEVLYYIWGAGECGKQCCKLFWAVGLQVAGFIDNNGNKKNYMGYPVISSEQLSGEEKICIGSELYEAEIKEQIVGMGYLEENIICFSKLRKQMIEYGRENCMDFVWK